MAENEKLRLDKYLWAIRAFKTRSISTEACKAGRIKMTGQNLKPSHIVKVGEEYTVQKGPDKKIIKVTGLLERRVDAKTAITFYQDSILNTDKLIKYCGGAFAIVHQAAIPSVPKSVAFPMETHMATVEDTTAYKSMFHTPNLSRDRGAGRPTKKDRREIDDLQEGWFE